MKVPYILHQNILIHVKVPYILHYNVLSHVKVPFHILRVVSIWCYQTDFEKTIRHSVSYMVVITPAAFTFQGRFSWYPLYLGAKFHFCFQFRPDAVFNARPGRVSRRVGERGNHLLLRLLLIYETFIRK